MNSKRARAQATKYAAALNAAKGELSAARRALAKATSPTSPPLFVQPQWQWAFELANEKAKEFSTRRGVVGVALGTKRVAGKDTSRPCLTVFVSRKIQIPTLQRRRLRPLPKRLRRNGRTLAVDVVQVGGLKRQVFTGQTCSVTRNVTRTGSIGAPAVNDAGGGAVFITAMHVTGMSELAGLQPAVNVPSTMVSPGAPSIGKVVAGTRKGIDAAKVQLSTPDAVSPEIPQIGTIRGWRPLTFPGDQGTAVTMFGAVSRVRHQGVIVHPAAFLPGWNLDSAILVRGLNTVEGDSGSALLDNERLVLGFLVGAAADGTRVFSPASLVLSRLGCDIPTHLNS